MKDLVFDLPAPISTNELFRNVPKVGRVKTTKYKHWQEEAGWIINAANKGRETYFGPVHVIIYVTDKWKGDIDNASKCVLDALQEFGVILNDKLVTRLTVERANVEGVRVIVRPFQAEAA